MPSARPGRAAEAAVPVAEAGPERDAPPPAPGIRVTGRLLDPDGRPAAGCTITALEAGAGKKPSSARSDASGAFQLRLTPGAFRFDAHDGTRVLERPVEIVVPDGAPAPDVQLRLAAGRAVSGTVRDTQGRPIAAALVFLDPVPRKKDNVPDPIGPRRAVSDAAGRYAFAGLRAGVFAQLRAEGVGFFPSEPRRGVVGGGNDPSGDLVLRPCATLSGIVVGPDEKPLAGAIVGAHQVGETTADAQGAFRLDRLPGGGGRGVQVLGRSADRRHIGKDEVFLSEGEAREGYRLVLQRSAAIRGRVLDPQGRGVAGARMTTLKEITPERAAQEEFVTFRGNLGAPPLQLNLPDLSARNARLIEAAMQAELQMVHRRRAADQQAQEGPAETDGEGRFEIFGLWPGKYHLQADAEGFLPPDPAIQVDLAQLGEEAFREIVLHRGAVVTGVVRGADGPLKGAHVFALQGAAYRADVTTDEEGAYRATGLPAGDYELFSRTEAYELLDQKSGLRFEIDQEYRGVDFLLLPGGRVQGRVLDSSGAPVAKASVTVQSTREGQVKRDAPTGDDGAYEVENLYDGEYAVIVVADGWLPYGPAPIPVRRGDRLSHDVQLRRAGFVTGRVVGPNGQPVAGALFVLRQGDLRETTNTDPEGRFELTGLRPGVHEMYCRSDDYTLNSRGEVTLEPEERREGLVIRIDPALVARGRVLGPDGRGRSGRKVIAVSRTNEQVRREGVTGGDGTFTVPNLYEGRYRFFLEGQEDAGGADAVVERGRAPPQLLLNARE
jgi:protocatechuate 3,4-dioxygenase beta subunit